VPNQLEFMDCPHCSKRVATIAKICRHCGKSPAPLKTVARSRSLEEEEETDESHMASEHGGYDASEDKFDYRQFVTDEFNDSDHAATGKKTWLWYTAWLMIIVLSLPLFLQVMSLLGL
jgi:cation transport ATPase